jgi:hypothetical protein
MKNVDRILVIVLAVGVWALVLKPTTIVAYDRNSHSCNISGQADGRTNGYRTAWVNDWSGVTVECHH